jgi:D-serine deaminase-like pyridoxal phosphate-dependent protein
MVDDVNRLRPHVKTYKSPRLPNCCCMPASGKFKCATIAEAEMLGMCKAPDVLLAYQPVGQSWPVYQADKRVSGYRIFLPG